MKRLLIILFCVLGIVCHPKASVSPRQVENLNRGWKFALGDEGQAAMPAFDDKDWESVGLPHSFSIPYFMSKDFYVGYGWYRKQLELTKADMDKAIFLEFDGVFQEAEVYVNGKLMGTHVGGYTGFSIKISEGVKVGVNTVAVRVNNLWKPDVAPRAGEHVFSGGIYRNVRMVMKSPVHIDWYGTFVTTPDLSKKRGRVSEVRIETEVCNRSAAGGVYRLTTQVLAPNGKAVASVQSEVAVEAGGSKKIVQVTKELIRPQLWSLSTPFLYEVVSRLYQDNRLIDEDRTNFGFRWFEWTADRGFFLNGKHLYFHGANVHQDQAGWGDAVTEAAMYRDVRMMKEAGFDIVRGSHYPHAPAFSDACDKLGMLFWSEAPFWGIGGFKPDGYWNSGAYPVNGKDADGFEESALQQLSEMIRIHRNHPSIVVWSMCNEAFFSAPKAMKGVRKLLKRMVDLSHELDPTRPAAVGGAQRPLGDERIDKIGDVAGYNGDGATQPDFQHPGISNVISEYGSTTAERPGDYAPGWGDLKMGDAWKGCTWRSGQIIWCGFDHGSIAGSALGKMGIVDYFRIPKRSWYWYRNEYAQVAPPAYPVEGVPAQLRIEATQTDSVLTDGTDDVHLLVTVRDAEGRLLKDAPSVRLQVISGPGEFPTGRSILFEKDSDIRILDGQAAIAFRSYYAGKTVVEATSHGLKPARVEINFVGGPVYKPGVGAPVKNRPYIRFVRGGNEAEVQIFGRNNPVFASSWQGEKSAGLAADGNMKTYWQATDGDASPWWMLDTEKGLKLHKIDVSFPRADCYRYVIEVSDDNKEWKVVLDKRNFTLREQHVCKVFAPQESVTGRFVRIRFEEKSPVAIAELEVSGVVRQ